MKLIKPKRVAFLLALILLLAVVGVAYALGGTPAIEWWVISSGGGSSSGGDVTLEDALGQPVVGSSSASSPGGDIVLEAGYQPGAERTYQVFIPLVMR